MPSLFRRRLPILHPRGTLLAGATWATGLAFVAAAHAQQSPGQGAEQARHYQIASGPLTTTLPIFIAQSGIVLAGSGDLARNRVSPALNGRYTPTTGLAALLGGTGLRAVRNAQGAFVLEAEPQNTPGVAVLPAVLVSGQAQTATGPVEGYLATQSRSGSKTDMPILKIPQTINVITADQMRDQGAQSVSQALRYTPGVLAETYGASSQFDLYTQVRGFRPAFFLDGTRLPLGSVTTGWASAVVEPYGLERIEVLKGPASALYGQSGPGGLINMVSKRPTAETLREVELQTGSFDRRQLAIDLGGPIDQDGKFLYRLTGMVREAGTQVDYIGNNRAYIAPALTWKLTPDTTLTLLTSYQNEWGGKTGFNYLPTSGTLTSNPNGRIPMHRYLGEPDFDRMSRSQSSVGYAFEHRFSDALTFRQNLRYNESSVDLRALNRIGELLPDNQTLNRAALGIDTGVHVLTLDNQLESRFQTGELSHDVVAGFDYRKESSHYIVGRSTAPPINVYHPVYGYNIATPPYDNFVSQFGDDRQLGLYAQDTISWGGWNLMVSGRHDWADSTVDNRRTGISTTQRDEASTGRVGLNYVFDNGIAPYVSYSTSFEPAGGSDFSGTPFKPTKGEQYEAGIKFQPPGTDSLLTASVFQIRQRNVLTPDPDPQRGALGFSVQTGEVRVRGLELEARTALSRAWTVLASYTYLDDEVTQSNRAGEVGNRLTGTPSHQASLWTDYTLQEGLLEGLGLGAGVRYVGSTFDTSNLTKTPDYTLVDLNLHYDLGRTHPSMRGARVSLGVTNLTDKYYLTQCTTGQGCTLGVGRTVLATFNYRW
ncbi:TonB-dependent siderophore receptor [Achromobacter pestifer]